ncbi:hypothetical protein [Nocardioides daeguensis]|uniref:Uncharacterized protein n=1 Tax=Nocardioides daeguensis TaxID=908359 RepID=A0ABP6UUN1_9ACTN|nr:hypothetical protein [Nocardioides daeguensis]MBV6728159.1 hypothetical protein [Nocardioides daeguensis]MCR1772969.1 hypothetical protein [Nocardioides daeguensis]
MVLRRGVDERVLGVGEQLLKAAADQALGRTASAHLEQGLWQQTAALLRQRRDWDRDLQVSPPPPAACLPCAVAVDHRPTHAGRRCRAYGGQLHRIVVDEGFDTHPWCDRPGANGSLAFLEQTAHLLGATLLAQPA